MKGGVIYPSIRLIVVALSVIILEVFRGLLCYLGAIVAIALSIIGAIVFSAGATGGFSYSETVMGAIWVGALFIIPLTIFAFASVLEFLTFYLALVALQVRNPFLFAVAGAAYLVVAVSLSASGDIAIPEPGRGLWIYVVLGLIGGFAGGVIDRKTRRDQARMEQ